MAWEMTLRCDRCRRRYQYVSGDIRYYAVHSQTTDFALTERVNCSEEDGWCHNCRRPGPIERILPLEALEWGRAKLLEDGGPDSLLAHVEARIRWRRGRS